MYESLGQQGLMAKLIAGLEYDIESYLYYRDHLLSWRIINPFAIRGRIRAESVSVESHDDRHPTTDINVLLPCEPVLACPTIPVKRPTISRTRMTKSYKVSSRPITITTIHTQMCPQSTLTEIPV